jgi:hypothetical protein
VVRSFGIRPLNWLIIFTWTCSAPCRRWCIIVLLFRPAESGIELSASSPPGSR